MAATTEFSIAQPYSTDRRSAPRWIISHAARYWPVALIAFLGALFNAGLAGISQVLVGQAFTAIGEGQQDLPALTQVALALVVVHLSRGILQLARNFGFELVGQRVERDVREELYVSLLGKSMTFHNLQPVGDTMARATNDVREVNLLFNPGLNMVVGSLTFLLMPLILTPRYHPALLATPLIFTILYVLALRNYLGILTPITDQVRAVFGGMNSRLAEALDGIETVKGSSQEGYEVGLFRENARRYRDATVRQGDEEARFLPRLLLGLAIGAGLLHALILFRQGLLTVGEVVGYMGLLFMLDFPTYASTFAYSQISLGLAGARRILELMNRETNLDQNVTGHSHSITGEIEFRGVSFGYGSGEESLQGISFTVKPGQTVAVVGQTGSGKTTLARLINRTYDVTAGQVLVDGVDVREWNLEALRRQISIIEQDLFLFSKPVRNNIAFGKPDASAEEIHQAAANAQASEFIENLDDGLDTVIGERGVTLSGGQRQRLALARAFLTDPRILILDDSTSAIDSATEDKIQRAIYAAAQGRTTILITHRLSQIRWADLILVIKRGRLVASGSHAELMESSEAYRRIFRE